MKVIHKFRLISRCPNNGDIDEYEVEVQTDGMIQCEELILIADSYKEVPVYQETLTHNILISLNGRATRVRTTGLHLKGSIQTEVVCE